MKKRKKKKEKILLFDYLYLCITLVFFADLNALQHVDKTGNGIIIM